MPRVMPTEVDPLALERIGRYPVRRYIAGGGMSWIFEVVDPELFDARRALKLLKPGEADREMLRRFRREAELLSRIQHPNLIHIYEFGEDSGTGCSFYTMDFIDGQTLAEIHPEWLASTAGGSTPENARTLEQIVHYFLEVLSALSRLHANRVVHRDIKPQNVFVDAQGRAVLGDLGIAKAPASADETRQGQVPGTPLYMAPEQSLSLEITTRTDVFSLGLSLYRVLTGRTVYDTVLGAESTNSLKVLRHLWNLQGAAQEFDFSFPAQVPEPLRAVIRRACRMSPEERYPSADAMAAALEDARRPPQPTAQSVAVAAARPRVGLWIGVAAAVLLALGGVYALFGGRGDREAALAARSDAEAAHALAAALVKQFDGRTGPGAPEALEDARRRVAYTEEEQADGERELADSSYLLAERQFARALEGYTRACQDLNDHWLRAAADAETQAAKAAAATGNDAALLERANALPAASAATGCSGAEAERARLVAAEALRAETGTRVATAPAAAAVAESTSALAAGAPGAATTGAPAAETPPKPVPSHRPVLPDRTAEKRAVAAAIATWNRALNARDWGTLQAVQKLRPGQLESYQQALASPNVRQSVSIRWIAELSPTRFETEVVIKREERKFFVWRDAGQDRRQAIAVLEGGRWRLTGL
jgi:tRNA A-37 threonylcarbamoyl transferase component Bud32